MSSASLHVSTRIGRLFGIRSLVPSLWGSAHKLDGADPELKDRMRIFTFRRDRAVSEVGFADRNGSLDPEMT